MIRQALSHLPGIGPGRLNALRQAGIRNWNDILGQPLPESIRLSPASWLNMQIHLNTCEAALQNGDLNTLIQAFDKQDHWRILAYAFDQASYFDIETSGLECDSYITLITCYHRGNLHTFVKNENLDDFLELLDDVSLLVSFNGASFDVPRILNHFHIPDLPCPHLDLRWICYHAGLKGGLKLIEPRLGIHRPRDLQGVDGAEAIWLWNHWEYRKNHQAREKLLRYGCADVLALQLVAAHLLNQHDCIVNCPHPDDLWQKLSQLSPSIQTEINPGITTEPSATYTSPLQQRLQQRWRETRKNNSRFSKSPSTKVS